MERVLCATKEQKVILLKHAIFKQNTQGKGDLLSGVSLLCWRDDSWAPGKRAELPRWRERCCVPGWAEAYGGRGCCATWGVMGNLEEHQERDPRQSKKERKAACSCAGAGGRPSSAAVWLSPACRTSHLLGRLLGSKWFLSKLRVLLTQKKWTLLFYVGGLRYPVKLMLWLCWNQSQE